MLRGEKEKNKSNFRMLYIKEMRRGPKCQEKKSKLGSYSKKKEKATVRSAPDGSDNNTGRLTTCSCRLSASCREDSPKLDRLLAEKILLPYNWRLCISI